MGTFASDNDNDNVQRKVLTLRVGFLCIIEVTLLSEHMAMSRSITSQPAGNAQTMHNLSVHGGSGASTTRRRALCFFQSEFYH